MTLVRRINSVRRITVEFRTITSKDSPTRRILIFRRETVTRTIYLSKRFLGSKDNSLTSKDARRMVICRTSLIERWSFDFEGCSKDGYLSNLLDRRMIFRVRKISFEHVWHTDRKDDWLVKRWCGWWTNFRQKGCFCTNFSPSQIWLWK